jgi:hypothetical protein
MVRLAPGRVGRGKHRRSNALLEPRHQLGDAAPVPELGEEHIYGCRGPRAQGILASDLDRRGERSKQPRNVGTLARDDELRRGAGRAMHGRSRSCSVMARPDHAPELLEPHSDGALEIV